jgi:hypothetical protein
MKKIFVVITRNDEKFVKAFASKGGAETFIEEMKEKAFNEMHAFTELDIVEEFIAG